MRASKLYSKKAANKHFNEYIEPWLSLSKADDVEVAIIGACLVGLNEENWKVVEVLQPFMFYNRSRQEIFRAIKELREENISVELSSVCERLTYEQSLMAQQFVQRIGAVEHIEFYVKIVEMQYLKRVFLSIITLAPALFDDSLNFDDFIIAFGDSVKPLNEAYEKKRAEKEQFEQLLHENAKASFVPHYLVKGDEKYKVYLSKFHPYNGYVWINGKAVKESIMLKKGFEVIPE